MSVRRVAAALVAAGLLVGVPAPASADPDPETPTSADVEAALEAASAGAADVAALQEQLDAQHADLDRVHETVEIAAEKANEATALLEQRTSEAAAAHAAAEAAAHDVVASQEAVEQMAAQLYMRGETARELAWLFALRTDDLARGAADIHAAMGHKDATLRDARAAKTVADDAKATAEAAQAAQREAAAVAASALAEARAALAEAQRLTARLEAERVRLVARLAELRHTSVEIEQRRQDALARLAEERRQAEVRLRVTAQEAASVTTAPTDVPDSSSRDVDPADLPAPDSAAAARAIAFAQAQLGKPYLWGGTGPGGFDCSGLTLGAWTDAGGALPRVAQWQYRATTRVPVSALAPGDLVFFGRDESSIHHVGLYVGGGQMIEAPRTGLAIRYSSIYRSSLLPSGGRVG